MKIELLKTITHVYNGELNLKAIINAKKQEIDVQANIVAICRILSKFHVIWEKDVASAFKGNPESFEYVFGLESNAENLQLLEKIFSLRNTRSKISKPKKSFNKSEELSEDGNVSEDCLELSFDEMPLSSEQDQILNNFLNDRNLEIQKVQGDGNCFFNAVGLYLGTDAQSLRNTIADYINANHVIFQDEINLHENISVIDYVNNIRNGAWGGSIDAMVIERVFQRQLFIIGPDGTNLHPTNIANTINDPIYVYYNGSNHYDGLLQKPTLQSHESLPLNSHVDLSTLNHNKRNRETNLINNKKSKKQKINAEESLDNLNVNTVLDNYHLTVPPVLFSTNKNSMDNNMLIENINSQQDLEELSSNINTNRNINKFS